MDYGSKFCPHCRYEFGEWAAQTDANQNSLPGGDSADNGISAPEDKKPKTSLISLIAVVAVIVAAIGGAVY